jgi:sialic acid synthase SpsE
MLEEKIPKSSNFNKPLSKIIEETNFSLEQHVKLKKFCEKIGIEYLCTPFSIKAAEELNSINVKAFKTGSGELTNLPFIDFIARIGKPMIISTGMSTIEEIDLTYEIIKNHAPGLVMMNCTSAYPPNYSDIHISFTKDMVDRYPKAVIGFSDHSPGFEVVLAAFVLGAKVIEKHFTLSRDSGSPDDAFSLTPIEFKQMVDSIRIIENTIGKITYGGVEGEKSTKNFRRSLFFVKDLMKDDVIDETCVRSIRPSNGIHTKYYWDIIGKKVNQMIKHGTPVSFDLIDI